jgi:predicted transcriptional regulator
LIATVAAHLEGNWEALARKLEAFVELLQPSIMLASLHATDDHLRRKHVRAVLLYAAAASGQIRKRALMAHVGLAEANVTRIMAPLIDCGWFERDFEGREVSYRLTDRGRKVAAPLQAQAAEARAKFPSVLEPPHLVSYLRTNSGYAYNKWGKLAEGDVEATGASNYGRALLNDTTASLFAIEPMTEPLPTYDMALNAAARRHG